MTRPIGETLALTLGVLSLLLGGLEVLARTDFARSHLPPPSVGSPQSEFEVKLNRLKALAEQDVQIDCFFLGSSMVNRGFDTEAFSRGFEAQTGEAMQCFNFGIGQLTASEAGVLAGLLVDRYDPQLIIYGASLRDFDENRGIAYAVIDIPWTQYQLGDFSVAGWLSHHSRMYAYFLTAVSWYRPDEWVERQEEEREVAAFGYWAGEESGALPEMPSRFRRWLADYQISEEDWAGLHQLANLAGEDVQVVLVEMPLPRTYIETLPHGEQDYHELFVNELDELARATGTPFWQTNSQGLIPDDHWSDPHHLTQDGAAIFGEWLGNQVGEMIRLEESANHTP